MSRGGRRQGQPGKAYGNRTDLQTNYKPSNIPQPAPPVGVVAAQQGPAVQPAQPTPTVAPAAGPPILPGTLGTFGPTQRPNEPLHAGLPMGPGAGPEALQPAFNPDPVVQAAAAFNNVPAVHQTPIMRALAAATQASAQNASASGVAAGGQ